MRRHLSLPGLILAVLLSVIGGSAQRRLPSPTNVPSPAEQDGLVHLVFSVTGKHHEFVNALQQSQFRFLDNGKPPLAIAHFENPTALPLRIGLLLDASNSARPEFPSTTKAAAAFVSESVRDPHQAFLLAFNEKPFLIQDFTADPDKLAAGLGKIRPGGATALWDAVYVACRERMMLAGDHGAQRRIIIVISDGDDNQSMTRRQEALQLAQDSEVIVYAIATETGHGSVNLKMLAEATGGRVFSASGAKDLTKAFHEIQDELSHQYSVLYKPDNLTATGESRAIQIEFSPPNKDLKVHARKAYRAPSR